MEDLETSIRLRCGHPDVRRYVDTLEETAISGLALRWGKISVRMATEVVTSCLRYKLIAGRISGRGFVLKQSYLPGCASWKTSNSVPNTGLRILKFVRENEVKSCSGSITARRSTVSLAVIIPLTIK